MLSRTVFFSILLIGLLLSGSYLYAQEDVIPVRDDKVVKPVVELPHHVDFGLGLGLDYGGLLGLQVGFAPVKHLTLFGAVGYYILQAGWNAGIKILLFPKTTKKPSGLS